VERAAMADSARAGSAMPSSVSPASDSCTAR
jgi:hypothetical protein